MTNVLVLILDIMAWPLALFGMFCIAIDVMKNERAVRRQYASALMEVKASQKSTDSIEHTAVEAHQMAMDADSRAKRMEDRVQTLENRTAHLVPR